jgi:hypothetical protein
VLGHLRHPFKDLFLGMAVDQQGCTPLCWSVSLCSSSRLFLPCSTTLPGFPDGSLAPEAASGAHLCTGY